MHGTTNIDDRVPSASNNLSDDEQYDGGDVLLTLHKEVEGKLSACRNMSLHEPYNVYCIHSTERGSMYKYVDMPIATSTPEESRFFVYTNLQNPGEGRRIDIALPQVASNMHFDMSEVNGEGSSSHCSIFTRVGQSDE